MTPSTPRQLLAAIAVAAVLAGCQSTVELDPCERDKNLGAASPCVMNFGEVLVGRSKNKDLTVHNKGEEAEGPFKLSGAQFSLSPEAGRPESTIEPKKKKSFSVIFRPDEAGQADGEFLFQRQPAPPETTLKVEGEGIAFRSEGKLIVRLDRDGDPDTTDDRRVIDNLIDFGERVVSTTRDEDYSRLILIENNTFATMQVRLFVPTTGSGFDTVEAPRFDRPVARQGVKVDVVTLRAGQEARLKVYFVPPEAKVYTAYIEAQERWKPNEHYVEFGLIGEGKDKAEDAEDSTDHDTDDGVEPSDQPNNQ